MKKSLISAKNFTIEKTTSNVPKIRSIEEYWRILEQKVFQNYLQTKKIRQLEAQIKLVTLKPRQSTPDLIHQKLDFARRHGFEKTTLFYKLQN